MKDLLEMILSIPGVGKHKRVISVLLTVSIGILTAMPDLRLTQPAWAPKAIEIMIYISGVIGTIGVLDGKRKDKVAIQ